MLVKGSEKYKIFTVLNAEIVFFLMQNTKKMLVKFILVYVGFLTVNIERTRVHIIFDWTLGRLTIDK